MNIFEEKIEELRHSKNYGVTFRIFDSKEVEEMDGVTFEVNCTFITGGTMIDRNFIFYNGKYIGEEEVTIPGTLLDPITISFVYPFELNADTTRWHDNPHFNDCWEHDVMKFATLEQLVEFAKQTGDIE